MDTIDANCFYSIALFFCKSFCAQIINAFGFTSRLHFDNLAGFSVIEHTYIFMSSSDRLFVHTNMLVYTVLVTFLQSSLYSTEHNSMYLFKGQAE